MKQYLAFIFIVVSSFCFGQKEANVWHFGDNRTIDFTSGEPVEMSGSAISAYEGCAASCNVQAKKK